MSTAAELLTFDFAAAPMDTMPATPTDDLQTARLAHGKAEAAQVAARAAYDAAMVDKIKVMHATVVTPEVQAIRAAWERAREDLMAAFGNYADSARALSRAESLARP